MGFFDDVPDLAPTSGQGAGGPLRLTVRPKERELLVRTILGEAANEPDEGQRAVAAVVRNRLQAGQWGDSIPKVLLAPNQFEPWNTQQGRSRMFGYKPDSEPYLRAEANADAILAGEPDPTGGATHFFAPLAQARLGRNPPKWAQGEPTVIGGHNFYGGQSGPTEFSAQNRPQKAVGGFFDDVADAQPVAPQPAVTTPVAERGHTTASGPQKLAIDFGNVQSAASQGTNPNVDRQASGLISAEVHQDELGNVLFRDPATGQMVPTDNSKHVVLRDPQDNTPKVFARTSELDEGPMTGVSRVAMQGLGSGAPTSRAGAVLTRPPPPQREQIIGAAERLSQTGGPVQVPRAVASDSMVTQQAGKGLTNVPFGGDPLIKAAEKTISQLGTKADEVTAGFGGGNRVTSGDTAKAGITEWITGKSADQATKLYDRVDTLVNPNVAAPLNETAGVISQIALKRSQASLPPGKATMQVLDAVQKPGGLTYEGVKTLRTNIGEMLKGGILPEGMSASELKQVYGALTKDLGEIVKQAGGPQASAAFDRANKYYQLISERRKDLAKIVGAKGDAPAETVFERMVSMAGSSSTGDLSRLAQARKAIGPQDWDEFVSGVVGKLGRDVAGEFSPDRFRTAYGKLTEGGKSILFRSTGKSDLAGHLDDIATVSQRFKELQKFANPSGTARGAMGGAFYFEPISMIKAAVGGRVLATILSRPATAAPAARWSRTYEALARSPSASSLAAFNIASRNLSNTVNAELGTKLNPMDFLRQIQGPMKSAAEDEQPKP